MRANSQACEIGRPRSFRIPRKFDVRRVAHQPLSSVRGPDENLGCPVKSAPISVRRVRWSFQMAPIPSRANNPSAALSWKARSSFCSGCDLSLIARFAPTTVRRHPQSGPRVPHHVGDRRRALRLPRDADPRRSPARRVPTGRGPILRKTSRRAGWALVGCR